MKKFLSLFFCFFIIFSFSCVNAVGIDMNISGSTDRNSINNSYVNSNSVYNNSMEITSLNIDNTSNSSQIQKVSTTTSNDEDFKLTVSDIIDIILIAVGIVIIFLGIAILIRLK